jgi:hypothetical protein
MKVRLGSIAAHCVGCGNEEFDRLEPPASDFCVTVQCRHCGKTTTDGALLVQIQAPARAEAGRQLWMTPV